jgi:two-component system, chemotaxis family, CheB/CheR fusion protein
MKTSRTGSKSATKTGARKRPRPLIVGIGASAGGLPAFKAFCANMPADSGMAFVLVQHLSPQHASMLVELLSAATAMPVSEAVDGAPVVANHVYVIPPNATLRITAGNLQVSKPAPAREHRRPIDTFLSSLAEDQKESAVGIILSGGGSDGTEGLRAIKELGGLTMAQADFDEHAMSGMPLSAAATGVVDHVLPVEEMPARLIAYNRHLLGVEPHKDPEGTRGDAGEHVAEVCALVRRATGHDFSDYKEATLVRRMQRRMQVLRIDTPPAYIERLRQEPGEIECLFRELLIGVSHFFRDPPAFEALKAQVVPYLIRDKPPGNTVRVWVPGCATGEEVYSIAILLKEAVGQRDGAPSLQIFATDIDEKAIAVARAARYRKSQLAHVPAARLERWFAADGDQWCPIREIREMCIFSTHSVIKDAPFSRLDLISCRNLLIYLGSELQDRVLRVFHYALQPGGYLFLGPSESVTRNSKLFVALDKKHRIFRRRDFPASLPASLRAPEAAAPRPRQEATFAQNGIETSARRLMERYVPAHIVVDGNHDVLRFSGQIDKYLGPTPGAASLNLFNLIRRGLRSAARTALAEARATRQPVTHEALAIEVSGRRELVDLVVEPLPDSDAGVCIVVFLDRGPEIAKNRSSDAAQTLPIEALEKELRTTRERLEATIDELETSNEEMRSANEEYQSVNEELQSTNEELETSKEEMQSINEELQTVNAELGSKNEQLVHLNSDLKNLLDSTQIATLFLDRDLRIKNFTPTMTDLFHLRDGDRGRPLTEIASRFSYDALSTDAMRVMRDLSVVEREFDVEGDASFLMRMRPYRGVDNVIDGVVVTCVDITERKRAEKILREHAAIVEFSQDALIGVTLQGMIHSWNPGAERLYGYSSQEAIGQPMSSLAPAEQGQAQVAYLTEARTGAMAGPAETIRRHKDGSPLNVELSVTPIRAADGTIVSLAEASRDISDRLRSLEHRNTLLHELKHRVKNNLAIVQAIAQQTLENSQTLEAFQEAFEARLLALSKSHDLLTQRNWEGALLRDLVLQELSPYRGDQARRVAIDGQDVQLPPNMALALSLALHELTTNAMKYGALSVATGRIDVGWEVSDGDQRRLRLHWVESGGPPVAKPSRRGLGSRLIERNLAHQLNGEARLDFDASGVRCTIDVPLAPSEETQPGAGARIPRPPQASDATPRASHTTER